MTAAKKDLIEVSLDSVQRFIQEWHHGEVQDAPFCPCLGSQLYITYKRWCDHAGERSPRSMSQFLGTIKNMPRWRAGQPLQTYENMSIKTIKSRKMVIPPDEMLETSANVCKKDGKNQADWLTECYWMFANAGEFE